MAREHAREIKGGGPGCAGVARGLKGKAEELADSGEAGRSAAPRRACQLRRCPPFSGGARAFPAPPPSPRRTVPGWIRAACRRAFPVIDSNNLLRRPGGFFAEWAEAHPAAPGCFAEEKKNLLPRRQAKRPVRGKRRRSNRHSGRFRFKSRSCACAIQQNRSRRRRLRLHGRRFERAGGDRKMHNRGEAMRWR
jgi:hypothetical protein